MAPVSAVALVMYVTFGLGTTGQHPVHLKAIEVHQTIGFMNEETAWVRLRKLGYEVQELVLVGDNWEATVFRNGVTKHMRLNAVSGVLQEMTMPQSR
jgi:hypothetical protein